MKERDELIEKVLRKANPNLNVFIVDDSELARLKMERLVVSFGWRVVGQAADGEDALEQFEKSHSEIDLVTLDIQMPVMDGLECLEEMLRIDPAARIIMVTSDGHLDTVKKAMTMGAKHFIVKPYERLKVMEAMLSVMKKKP